MSTTMYVNDKYDNDVASIKRELASLFFEYDGSLAEYVGVCHDWWWSEEQERVINPITELRKLRLQIANADTANIASKLKGVDKIISILEYDEFVELETK